MENTSYLKGFSAGVLSAPQQPLNPWVSMWTQPRETVRHLMLAGQDGRVLLLAALAGITQVFDRATGRNLGDSMAFSNILLLSVLLGSVGGIGGLYLGSWLTARTGRWLGGVADAAAVRVTFAWSSLPEAAGLALWLLAIVLLGPDLFTEETPRIVAHPLLGLVLAALMLGLVGLGIWSIVLAAQGLAEVQGFASAWRGLGNLLLSLLVIVGVGLVVGVGVVLLLRPFIG